MDERKYPHLVARINTWIWKERSPESVLSFVRVRVLRPLWIASLRFSDDSATLRASALTFYSLLSIVPLLALFFGIAKGFGFEQLLEQKLYQVFEGQEAVLERALIFSRSLLENTRGGLVAGIGIIVLLWSVMKALAHLENALNDLWGVEHPRSLLRRYADYLSVLVICPVLLIVSSSSLVLLSQGGQEGSSQSASETLLQLTSPLLAWILPLIPIVAPSLTFAFLYTFLPNTRVKIRFALLGGLVGGLAYSAVQYLYVTLQIGASSAGAIYGSFAALPLFLAWLQLSWVAFLLGAEFSYVLQNLPQLEQDRKQLELSISARLRVALLIVGNASRCLLDGKGPLTESEIQERFPVPQRETSTIVRTLIEAGILGEIQDQSGRSLAMLVDPHTFTVQEVLQALIDHGDDIGRANWPPLQLKVHSSLASSAQGSPLELSLLTLEQLQLEAIPNVGVGNPDVNHVS